MVALQPQRGTLKGFPSSHAYFGAASGDRALNPSLNPQESKGNLGRTSWRTLSWVLPNDSLTLRCHHGRRGGGFHHTVAHSHLRRALVRHRAGRGHWLRTQPGDAKGPFFVCPIVAFLFIPPPLYFPVVFQPCFSLFMFSL